MGEEEWERKGKSLYRMSGGKKGERVRGEEEM